MDSHRLYMDIVKMLLSRGADPNRADVTGWTPLHMAAQSGHKDVVNVCRSVLYHTSLDLKLTSHRYS